MYFLRFICITAVVFLFTVTVGLSQTIPPTSNAVTQRLLHSADSFANVLAPKVIAWRRDIHQHPELGNREFRTSKLVADYLKSLGFEVKTGIAKTGVAAILKGGLPGPVVALRADMDALPITERNDLPYRSHDSTMYNGKLTGVSHTCGHDSHVAMLMGTATILASMKKELHGTVKFIFQPSEEGPPSGELGGAKEMVQEGVLDNPKVDVIFGQHISSGDSLGVFTYKPGPVCAENDIFRITVHGKQSHGAAPWASIDPIVTASQIVMGLQTIISRNAHLTDNAAVLTVGSFNAGNRENIIPEQAVLTGTIRTLDTIMRNTIQRRVREVVQGIAESAGATADVKISMEDAMLVNDVALTSEMVPTLQAMTGEGQVKLEPPGMGAEDFAYFAQKVKGFYFETGALLSGKNPSEVGHHTPGFLINESSFVTGVKALCYLTLNYMDKHAAQY